MRMAAWFFLLAALGWASAARGADDATGESVVKILVTQRLPDFVQPWTKAAPREASGTGFVIDGRRILTNFHVVQYATQIYVQPNQSADKIAAKVLATGPAIDLAVIGIDDATFFDNRPPIAFAEGLPKIKAAVNVFGFPVGGEQLSVTEGIVSRVEYASYSYRGGGIRVQIDAALNPGNSGGPALSNGRLVGVAFSGLQMAENIGYLIPAEEVVTFLKDIEDGKYDGKPHIFDELQTVENEALRARLGLPKETGGVLVYRPQLSDASYPLKEFDVITHIGEKALDNAGRVKVSADLSLSFQYYVPKLAHDGVVPLTIFRGGKSSKVDFPVSAEQKTLVPYLKGGYPRYFIYGPLVFSPAYREYVAMLGDQWHGALGARNSPLLSRLIDPPSSELEELVIITGPTFDHPITKGYSQPTLNVLSQVNGTPVRSLTHLVELLRDATGEFLEFRFADRFTETMVFRRQEIAAATDEILSDNSIRKQCSEDLEKVWRPAK